MPESVVQEAGKAAELVWTGAENLAPPEFDPRPFQSLATPYTDYAISAQGREEYYCLMFRVYLGISTEWSAL
jgi:hypothetical protein